MFHEIAGHFFQSHQKLRLVIKISKKLVETSATFKSFRKVFALGYKLKPDQTKRRNVLPHKKKRLRFAWVSLDVIFRALEGCEFWWAFRLQSIHVFFSQKKQENEDERR